jgi:sigma-B regulation protein RsbU (phosphoserine phosphatase)
MERLIPAVAAAVCGAAAFAWARAALSRHRVASRLGQEQIDPDLWRLAHNDYRRDLHSAVFSAIACLALLVAAVAGIGLLPAATMSLLAVPAGVALAGQASQLEIARIAANRAEVEKKAREVLSQEELAPLQWAARLAPSDLPDLPGFEIGQAYQAGSGAMAGDFYDVFRVDEYRVAAVIGDVTGHGIEPSITALQAKYLLRAFLLQFRDPGQAVEQLNAQMSVLERGEEFISLCVLGCDTDAETLRYASAGHPAAFVWHGREVRPLGAPGPLLMLDSTALYHAREQPWKLDDVAVLYTDGLAEARNGDAMFGEDGVASMIRRDPTASPEVLTKVLVEAARDFAGGPITDDLAVLVLRRV